MGSKKVPYDEVLSGRVTARDKQLMKESGYRLRDAVGFFLAHSVSPKKKLLVEKHLVTERIEEINEEIENLKLDLISEEMKLEEINNELGIVELNGKEYSYDVYQAVDMIVERFSKTSYDLETYFQTNRLLVENQAAINKIEVDELKELVKEKLCKQV